MAATELVGVTVKAADVDRVTSAYRRICGTEPTVASDRASFLFDLGDASLELVAAGRDHGVASVTLRVSQVAARGDALSSVGIYFNEVEHGLEIDPSAANGLQVALTGVGDGGQRAARARLDHVAVRVRDLHDAMRRWEAICGAKGHDLGIHPVSNGAFTAARFLLGERMIELIAPVPGVASPMADRLRSHGEGVAALALPVDDVNEVRRTLEETGVRVLRQPPHWMVHPTDAGGVLVQLTPRMAH